MEEIKIILTGFSNDDLMSIAETLTSLNDSFTIGQIFTNDSDKNDIHSCYINNQELELICKNSAYLTLLKEGDFTHGISMDEFYNCNLFVMQVDEFNNISPNILSNNNILVVWFDTKYSD